MRIVGISFSSYTPYIDKLYRSLIDGAEGQSERTLLIADGNQAWASRTCVPPTAHPLYHNTFSCSSSAKRIIPRIDGFVNNIPKKRVNHLYEQMSPQRNRYASAGAEQVTGHPKRAQPNAFQKSKRQSPGFDKRNRCKVTIPVIIAQDGFRRNTVRCASLRAFPSCHMRKERSHVLW